jgi:hypothetical protein
LFHVDDDHPIAKLIADDRAMSFLSTATLHAEQERLRHVDAAAAHPLRVDSVPSVF